MFLSKLTVSSFFRSCILLLLRPPCTTPIPYSDPPGPPNLLSSPISEYRHKLSKVGPPSNPPPPSDLPSPSDPPLPSDNSNNDSLTSPVWTRSSLAEKKRKLDRRRSKLSLSNNSLQVHSVQLPSPSNLQPPSDLPLPFSRTLPAWTRSPLEGVVSCLRF